MDEVNTTITECPKRVWQQAVLAWWQRCCKALVDTTTRITPGRLWLLAAAMLGLGLLVLAARWPSSQSLPQPALQQESPAPPLLLPSVSDNAATAPAGKAYLGIRGKTFHHSEVQGVKVLEVFPGSPAAQAGLRTEHHPGRIPGHIIIGCDGRPIRSEDDLAQILAQRSPGTQVQLFLTNATGRRSDTIYVEFSCTISYTLG